MASTCRDCKNPVEWLKRGGRNVPVEPGTETDHRDRCEVKRGMVPDGLRKLARTHVSQYRIKRFGECQRRSYFADVLGLDDFLSTDEGAAGKIFASGVEFVAWDRHRSGVWLGEPVTSAEFDTALAYVAGRSTWTPAALYLARGIAAKALPRIDLALAFVDEKGPWVERAFELPCGEGVIAGGVFDQVDMIAPDEIQVTDYKSGQWRDPSPRKSIQVGLYLAQAKAVWPEAHVTFALKYVAMDVADDVIEWSPEIEANAKAAARALVLKSRFQSEDEEAWPATVSGACASCAFNTRCSTFREAMKVPADDFAPRTPAELAAAIHRYGPVATAATNLVKGWREQLKREPVFGSDGHGMAGAFPVRLSTRERKAYDVEAGVYQVVDVYDPVDGAAIQTGDLSSSPSQEGVGSSVAAPSLLSAGASPVNAVGAESGPVTSVDEAAPAPAAKPKRGRPRKKTPEMVVLSETLGPPVTTPFLREAVASVALDKGPYQTVVSECKHGCVGPCKLCGEGANGQSNA